MPESRSSQHCSHALSPSLDLNDNEDLPTELSDSSETHDEGACMISHCHTQRYILDVSSKMQLSPSKEPRVYTLITVGFCVVHLFRFHPTTHIHTQKCSFVQERCRLSTRTWVAGNTSTRCTSSVWTRCMTYSSLSLSSWGTFGSREGSQVNSYSTFASYLHPMMMLCRNRCFFSSSVYCFFFLLAGGIA